MNQSIERSHVMEMSCGANIAYILENNGDFQVTEYKVLQNQSKDVFLRCMKMTYNGKVQLYYITEMYKSLPAIMTSLDSDAFITVIINLLSAILNVKSNGFLSCQNLDVSFEHIFVDPATLTVKLVYLPLSKKIFSEFSVFENYIRTNLVRLISGIVGVPSQRLQQLVTDLANGTYKLEDIFSRTKRGDTSAPATVIVKESEKKDKVVLRITAMNAPARVEFTINKDEFVLGKNKEVVDGVLSFNQMISRVHCKINRTKVGYTITDLKSKNGTYVNKVRLQPDVPCSIKNGDVICLANSDFQISIT